MQRTRVRWRTAEGGQRTGEQTNNDKNEDEHSSISVHYRQLERCDEHADWHNAEKN